MEHQNSLTISASGMLRHFESHPLHNSEQDQVPLQRQPGPVAPCVHKSKHNLLHSPLHQPGAGRSCRGELEGAGIAKGGGSGHPAFLHGADWSGGSSGPPAPHRLWQSPMGGGGRRPLQALPGLPVVAPGLHSLSPLVVYRWGRQLGGRGTNLLLRLPLLSRP